VHRHQCLKCRWSACGSRTRYLSPYQANALPHVLRRPYGYSLSATCVVEVEILLPDLVRVSLGPQNPRAVCKLTGRGRLSNGIPPPQASGLPCDGYRQSSTRPGSPRSRVRLSTEGLRGRGSTRLQKRFLRNTDTGGRHGPGCSSV